ncbi:unnamed protein product, partial [Prunus brigantina]
MIDYARPEQGRNLHPINALNDVGALQRMIREMMEPEARRGERPTYRKPYPAYIDQIPLPPGFKVPNFTLFNGEDPHASSVEHIGRFSPEITISDLAALKQSEDEPAQDFITRFRKLKMKCRIPMEERHFIQMAQAALKISLRKRFDGMLFGDLAELADKASKYEELLKEEQQKRNSSKGTYYKSPIHLVQIESEEEIEYSEEGEVAVAEMAKLKHPISCKALTKPPKDQKPPPFTGGFVPNKPIQNKVYSFDLTKVDALFDEMLLQKAIETPHRMPKPEELKGRQTRPTTETSSSRDRMVSRETNERPKATISAGMVLCSKCKCEAELEVALNRQSLPMPSVFDRIGTSSRDRARQEKYPRPAQHNRRMTEQPKKEISIKMPGNDKPLAAIIEGRWYAVGKSGRPTMELTRTQKRRAFGAELEGLLQGNLGINMVFILSEKFWAAEGQESTLEGDVFSQESFECRLAEAEEVPEQQASIMVDGGAAINPLPYRMLSKMGRTEKDLIPTRLTVTNFAGGITKTHGILDVDVIVGSKKLKIAFFVVDTTSTTYNALLGRDWIHQS